MKVWTAGGHARKATVAPNSWPTHTWRSNPWSASHPEAERKSSISGSNAMISSPDSPWPEKSQERVAYPARRSARPSMSNMPDA